MSQEKVNAYKESKATRKEDALKQRNKKKMVKYITRIVIAIVVIGLGVGIYFTIKNNTINSDDAWEATNLQIKDYVNIENSTESAEEETEEGEEETTIEGETTAEGETTTAEGETTTAADETTQGVTSSGAESN